MHQKRNKNTRVKILCTSLDYTTIKIRIQFEVNPMKNERVFCHA